MNREIKFRVWHKRNKRFYNVNTIDFTGNQIRRSEPSIVDDNEGGCFFFRNCILEQYTGLKDKNGKEIYEGDIVKGRKILDHFDDGKGINIDTGNGIIYWSRDGFRINYKDIEQTDMILFDEEIIGNIHEAKK